MTRPCVDIIGAGITGLTTARLLLDRGLRVRIHEARPEGAGLAATFENQGFRFDYGPHEFCTENPELIRLLEDVVGEDLLIVRKRVAQWLGDELRPFPFRPADVLKTLPLTKALRAVTEVGGLQFKRAFRSSTDTNFERWTRNRFGDTLWNHYFGPYTQKVWGVNPAELDAEVARRRISVDSAGELLWKTLRHRWGKDRAETEAHSAFRPRFRYFRGGVATLARKLQAEVRAAGAEIHFGREVVALEQEQNRVCGLSFANGQRVRDVDTLVSTLPLPKLLRLALEEPNAEALLARHPLPYRGMVFVFVRLAKESFTDHHWVYCPEPRLPFQRWTEFAPFGAGMTPEGHTGLALEIATNPGETWWEMSDADIADACTSALREIAPLDDSEVLGLDVRRLPSVYPLQVQGYRESVDAALSALGPLTNLTTLGRQGLFRYCNMNECMEMAMEVAPRIAAGEGSVVLTQDESWRGVGLESD